MKKSRTLTLDDTTTASNPGGINFMPLVYLRYYPIWGVSLAFLAILSVALLFLLPYSFNLMLFSVVMIFANFFYWFRKKEHFKFGDSNPGKVIQNNPTLIAVLTNLSKYGGNYPVIKIIKSPLKDLSVGEIIGTVALYFPGDNKNLPHWKDFDPIPLQCATNNKMEAAAVVSSYSKEELAALEIGINSLAKPYKKGLYKMYSGNSNWVKA
ncbi:DUF3239 domain-containing protein [uncultured Thiothrix sp.]|uniref:DUF3239 domain-containing protein n=1 Tax=uncultured Thiothrix sp. TaxID=223185 RepID=UPI002633FDB6|nr:DUF3239 domain-containing protein [uncultured Thiothrix sp.]